ncbi:MAG: heavy metal translocating P-type ATPase [Caldilineaceae bacterium]
MIASLIGGVALVAGGRTVYRQVQRRQLNQQVQELYEKWREYTQTVGDQVATTVQQIDDNYQQFMVEKVDPLFGSTRRAQLDEIVAAEETLVISDYERQLNRYLTAAVATLGTAIIGAFFRPILVVTLGTALYSTTLIFRNGYNAIFKERRLRMDVMGSLYFIGAYAGGYFMAGSFGLVAFYLSEKLVFITQDRSQKSLVQVFAQQPRTVWQLIDDVEVEVPFASIKAGDIVVLHAGQHVTIDGTIIQGMATIDQHMLTGEAQPVERSVGDAVLTSTLLLGGKVQVQVEKTGEETVAANIGAMLNNTASYQAGIVSKGEAIADQSVPPSMLLALLALPLAGYQSMVTILGSAIGLNIKITAPIAMLNFLNLAAKHGILIKDGRSLELLKEVDTFVFDKTGTLTLEQPQVTQIHTCGDLDADQVLLYAAAAEHRQTHPVARAILAAAVERQLALPEIDHAHYEIGYGLRVQMADCTIYVGSDRYMALENIAIPDPVREQQQAAQGQGHSVIMVAVDQQLVGAIELEPTIRPEARAIIQELRDRNLDIYIISGDQEQPTRKLAQTLGITHYFANTLPEHKADMVERLQQEGRAVCFVGDGINDSIALKKANVSVSLRGASTAATDTAQIVLMAQSLQQLPYLYDLAQKFDRNMKAGFTAAVGQGVIVIGGALLGVVGIFTGTLIWEVGLLTGLGVAMLPILQERKRKQE